MFVFGAVIAIVGGLLPELLRSHDLNPGVGGSLFLFLNSGALLVTLASGFLLDRIGPRATLLLCSLLTGTGFLWMAGAGSFGALGFGVLLIGLGGGGLNAGPNAVVSDLYPLERGAALNRLGVCFGVGALSIPLLIGSMLGYLGVVGILKVAAVLGFLPGFLFLTSRFPARKSMEGPSLHPAGRLSAEPVVLLFGVLLFFQGGNEVSTGGWLTTYLTGSLSASPAVASLYLSGFWGGITLGRLLTARLLRDISEATLVRWTALFSTLVLSLLIALPHPILSAIFAVLAGVGLSGIFPSVLGQASHRFPAQSATVLGSLMAAGIVGGMLIPWLAGFLVELLGSWGALLPVVAGTLAVFLIQSLIQRRY